MLDYPTKEEHHSSPLQLPRDHLPLGCLRKPTKRARFKATEFYAERSEWEECELSNFKEKLVIVYFYPAYETLGCTKQAFASKYTLPFTLLSEEGNKVRKEWGVPGDFFGSLLGRQTYVLDKNGVVHNRGVLR
ncbi:Peroxiredoxin Q, chloroplastic [Glycine max]|nr:Peroxiredoxin Q, chloroplastic [Glycine max]